MTLDEAIEEQKENVSIEINKELKKKIEYWIQNNIFYGLFPITGDSMTCDNKKNIPNRSHVLANQIKNHNVLKLPINKPLLIEIKGIWHKTQFVCKTISLIDNVTKRIRLTSYNPKHKDIYIPYAEVGRVFEVQKVFLPNTLTSLNN